MNCPNCGKNNPPEARFCRYCGTEIKSHSQNNTNSDDDKQEIIYIILGIIGRIAFTLYFLTRNGYLNIF